MKIIKTSRELMAMDMWTVKLLPTSKAANLMPEMVDILGRFNAFTFGVYHYELCAEESLCDELLEYNLIIRLMDSVEGEYVYMVNTIDFGHDFRDVAIDIHCNISFALRRNLRMVEESIDHLKSAERKANRDAILSLGDIRFKIEYATRTTTLKSVKDDVASAVEFYKPQVAKPAMCLSIERVPVSRYKREVMRYGIVVTVGDYSIPISFLGNDQTMLYLTALIRHKMGKPLYRHEFIKNSKGRGSAYHRDRSRAWFKSVYHTIISSERGSFDKWMANIQDPAKSGRALSQAKSQSCSIIGDKLEMSPEAKSAYMLQLETDADNNTYYTFACSPDSISLSIELQELIGEFGKLYSDTE